ncbi:coiled-coil domain-containing protein 9-like isoform X2 [Saccostrea echinata]|uniref:coiled-coil domain-containing protein 9-like isoform X2 n=1 Tax=Saccostrea echinata TaxID=191078 RepID=UPI002A81CFBA|nr:coiled-coil domain-containing protein 9-like isoform X2 [Saccostrea echinata]
MTSQVNANQELFLDILTKEEKEALLTKKMEEIRKKNEALRKRHEEIEADKRAVSGGAKKVASPRKESKPLPGEEVPKEPADGRKERPRQPRPAGRGKSPSKGVRDTPKAQDIRVTRNLSGEDGSIERNIQMSNYNEGSTKVYRKKNSKHSQFQRPGSQSFPDEEAQENERLGKPRYRRPFSSEEGIQGDRYQRHSSNEEDQGRNQRRGKRPSRNPQVEEVSDGAYEALKRQHQQLNYQPRNQEFREHDFRDNRHDRDGRNKRHPRPHVRNGDARRSFEDNNQNFSNGFQDKRYPQDHSEFEPQAKRMQSGMKGFQRKENQGYDFSKSPLGPPPDPAYNFLSDRYRLGERPPENPRGETSRRHPKNYGGEDFGNVKNRMRKERERRDRGRGGPPRNKMEMAINMTGRERREYVEWKAERDKVDQARIDRQKSASGEWKREWDTQKDHTEEASQRMEPGKRPAPGRKDSKESGGKPQPNGVGQEHIVEKDAVHRPVGRGRGRGRARNRGSGSGNDPGRVRTYSGEDRHVECKKDLLVIKVDNTPGTKSDQVEVEYSDGENEAHSGDHTAAHHKKAGPHAEELWWDEEGDDIGLELQGIPAEDDIFEQKDLFNDYHGEGYDKNGHFEDAPGQTSQGDDDEWEDCTTSEDFSTDRSQSQTSVSDDLTSPLKVNLNPDAPVFTPASPTSPSPLAAKVSKEQKIEKASPKEKKTKELKVGDGNISKNKEEKAPLDSKKEKTEHSKSDTDHSDSGKADTKPEESSLAPSEEELKGEVFEKPTMADSHTTQEEPDVKADTNPDDKGQSDENQTLIDPPTDMLPKEEADQDDTKKNSETVDAEKQKPEVEDETDSHDDIAQEAIEEKDDREDKEATPTPQKEEESAKA